MIKKIHNWSPEDEQLLSQAVMDLDPLREEYQQRGVPIHEFWSAVAGRIAPVVVVTGKACRERWKKLEEQHKAAEQPEQPDAWAQVAARVEQYEQDLGEATYDTAAQILRAVELLRDQMGASHTGLEARMDKLHAEVALLHDESRNFATEGDVDNVYDQVREVEAKVDRLLAEWIGGENE